MSFLFLQEALTSFMFTMLVLSTIAISFLFALSYDFVLIG